MFQQLYSAFGLAIENLRNNFFHTLLSILGIVIGVASLVSILSLIDGMERFARDQISTTTSLKNITIRTLTSKSVNNVQVKKDSFQYIGHEEIIDLQQKISDKAKAFLISQRTGELALPGESRLIGANIIGITPGIPSSTSLAYGRKFESREMAGEVHSAIINRALAALLTKDTLYEKLVGSSLVYKKKEFKIIGILSKDPLSTPTCIIPFSEIDPAIFSISPPVCNIEAERIEDVPTLKAIAQSWIDTRFKENKTDFECVTNELRVAQVRKGFTLFRIVMGLIVGISVVVGGIGIMNVLLISITERTSEIGIRKALGANRKDIIRLFLSESITLSVMGSVLGILLGVLITVTAIPIIQSITQAPFQAAFTLNTILIIAVISILIGIIFGTYPALKAAKLDPVVAIQRT